ncbi:MAG: FAD-dependent oxidoreductase [Cucumibacter sp.]
MQSSQYDLAVFGSTPLALYLAAMLAEDQSRRIVLIHNPATRVRLLRGLDLSVGALTRPEAWRRLVEGTAETLRRLGGAGLSGALEHCDILMMRAGPPGRAALGHVRAMASAHGIAVERIAAPANPAWDAVGRGAHALLIRDAWRFAGERGHDGFAAWHKKLGVERLARAGIEELLITRDGTVRMSVGGRRIAVDNSILADDEAIHDHANAPDVSVGLRSQVRTGFLTEPIAERLPGRVTVVLGEGFSLLQRPGGALSAIGDGAGGPAAERLLRFLPMFENARLAGRAHFHSFDSRDGAPQAGRGKTRRTSIVGGLGESGFFLAPSLARYLTGAASPEEKSFWAARALGRDGGPRVDELGASLLGAA